MATSSMLLVLLVAAAAFAGLCRACVAIPTDTQPLLEYFPPSLNATAVASGNGLFYVAFPTFISTWAFVSGASAHFAGTQDAGPMRDGNISDAARFGTISSMLHDPDSRTLFVVDGFALRVLNLTAGWIVTVLEHSSLRSASLALNTTHLFTAGTAACVRAVPLRAVFEAYSGDNRMPPEKASVFIGTCEVVAESYRYTSAVTNLSAPIGEVVTMLYAPPSLFMFFRTRYDSRWVAYVLGNTLTPGAYYTAQSGPFAVTLTDSDATIAVNSCSLQFFVTQGISFGLSAVSSSSPSALCAEGRTVVGVANVASQKTLLLLQSTTGKQVAVVVLTGCTIGQAATIAPQSLAATPAPPSSVSTSAPPSSDPPSSGPSTQAIIAISVAAAAVVILVALLGGCCVYMRHRDVEDGILTPDNGSDSRDKEMSSSAARLQPTRPSPLPAMSPRQGEDVADHPVDRSSLSGPEQTTSNLITVQTTADSDADLHMSTVVVEMLMPNEEFTRSLARHEKRAAMVQHGAYTKGKLLGRGANGAVYAILLKDGSTIAMKEVALMGSGEEIQTQIHSVEHEAKLLHQLRHPNVVIYYGTTTDTHNYVMRLFMECVTGGSLGAMVRGMQEPLDPELGRNFARQIVLGLAYMHSRGVMHRDLKCDNVLRDESTGTVKLADFGTARIVQAVATHCVTRGAQTMIGTPLFMAPEVCGTDFSETGSSTPTATTASNNTTERGYGRKADIWSLGITIVELLNRGNPPWPDFPSPGHAFMYIAGGGAVRLPAHLTPLCRDFVERCLTRNPAGRPHAHELLLHPWLAQQ
jgi:tRNA A-37 threonylcarbamoyl transferase component Bud32